MIFIDLFDWIKSALSCDFIYIPVLMAAFVCLPVVFRSIIKGRG